MAKYYRTVVQIESLSSERYKLSDEPGDGDTSPQLDQISYDITDGACSGDIKIVIDNEEKTADEMAALLKNQGSDPSFLVSEYGDDAEDAS